MRRMRAMVIWLISLVGVVGALSVSLTQAQETGSDRRTVVVGIDDDYAPIEFTDSEGNPQGFAVDMMRAVAEEMRLDLEFRPGKWSDVREWLVRGEIDVVAGMLRSERREEEFLFSQRLKSLRHSVFIRTGSAPVTELADLAGWSIIVTEGDIGHEFLQSRGLGANLALVASVPESLRLLASGEFDCAVVPLLIGRELARVEGLDNIHSSGPALFIVDLCIATQHDRGELVSVLDQGLQRVIHSGLRDELYAKWFGAVDPGVSTLGEVVRYSLMVIGLLLALLAAVMLWSWSLRRRVAERTTRLSRELAERERAESALRTSEQRYRSLVSATTAVFWITNPEGEFIEPQESWELYTGQPWEVHKGPGWGKAIHPDDLPRVAAEFQAVMRTGVHSGITGRIWHQPTKAYRQFEAFGVPIRNEDGSIREWIGTLIDVEERTRATRALAESQSVLNKALSVAKMGAWYSDPGLSGSLKWSEQLYDLFGLRPEQFKGTIEDFFALVHPDDKASVRAASEAALRGERPYGIDHRIVRPDGTVRWIHEAAEVIRDGTGRPTLMIGVSQDITDRVVAEQELQVNRTKLAAIIESAMDAMVTVDESQHIVMFNGAAERMFGIESQQALGMPLDSFIPKRYQSDHRRYIERFGDTGVSRRAMGGTRPLAAIRANGEEFPIDASISQVVAGGQKLFTVILRDVTEREHNERRQKFMMQELDHRVKNNLAAVLSIADTTMAGSRSLEEFSESFRGRILALARSHVALAEAHWTGVDLKRLVEQTVSPYQDQSGSVVDVDGEPLELPPGAAAAVSMTLNELCTNAVKHGALSTHSGHVRVEWRKEEKGSQPLSIGVQNMDHVVLTWTEQGGPSTQAPSKNGMGLALMEGLIGHELAGKIDFQFGEEGLSCSIRFPLDRSPTHPVLD